LPWSYLIVTENAIASHFKLLGQLLKKNVELPDKMLFFAGSGDGFIGFKNRQWVAVPGNMHLTVYLKPARSLKYIASGFTILAAVSVLQVLDLLSVIYQKSKIRWVNDIVIDNKKLAGVLTRTQVRGDYVESVQIGVGINVESVPAVQPDIFVPEVASIKQYHNISLNDIFLNYIDRLYTNYDLYMSGLYDRLWQQYVERSVVTGRRVSIYSDSYNRQSELIYSGVVKRIGKDLELYLEDHHKPVTRGRVVME
jgi:BirA family biotin operon repressor/biotin-[acetyl-CoA-carboxylase] ligase